MRILTTDSPTLEEDCNRLSKFCSNTEWVGHFSLSSKETVFSIPASDSDNDIDLCDWIFVELPLCHCICSHCMHDVFACKLGHHGPKLIRPIMPALCFIDKFAYYSQSICHRMYACLGGLIGWRAPWLQFLIALGPCSLGKNCTLSYGSKCMAAYKYI